MNEKRNHTAFMVMFSAFLIMMILVMHILRLRNIPITWDEGLTYVIHCQSLFYSDGFWKGIVGYLSGYTRCAGNNHLLNTILIGIAERSTGIRFNEYIIRFPTTVFLLIYLFVSFKEYIEKRITEVGFTALICCAYLDEFFALARGYAMSAALVLIASLFYMRWIREKKKLFSVLAFYTLIIAEISNTAALLIAAAFSLEFLFDIIINKKFKIVKKLWIPMLIYIMAQGLIIIHHLHITEWDSSLYSEKECGVGMLIYRTLTIQANDGFKIVWFSVVVLLFILNVLLVIRFKTGHDKYILTIILILYFLICFTAVGLTGKGGYPKGRVLLIAYPVVALAIDELFQGIIDKTKMNGKVGRMVMLLRMFVTGIILLMFIMGTNVSKATDWPNANRFRDASYEALSLKEQTPPDHFSSINRNMDGFLYWREKIKYEYNIDIYSYIEE
ncbi:hypothetical protein SAMN02910370_02702 [Lachnospiraceae bacterium XPB1003]|nr:hypothetical protein SAMN02910370_02702 [Lachnospiraceae bacterium XPB1003]